MLNLNIVRLLSRNNFRGLHLLVIFVAIAALSSAYYVEYIMHIAPCPLCIYERFPYLSLIKVALTALLIKKMNKYALLLLGLTFFVATLLAGYHVGIERDIFKPSSFCSTVFHIPEHLSISNIKKMLYNQPVATCAKAGLKIFNISMAEWNFTLNCSMLLIITLIGIRGKKHAKT